MPSLVLRLLSSWRVPAALLLFVFSLHGGSSLPSHPRVQSLSPGVDYVQGELIVTFSEHFMPSEGQVSLASRTFGIATLDSVLSVHECYRVHKFLSTYGRAKSEGGKRLERTFLLKFRDGTDAQILQASLLQLPLFERVSLNSLLEREYGSIAQRFPTGSIFDQQWYFHDEANDSADIDAPEAWAITGGSPDVVICIHDNGAMVDTNSTPWRLHSDFNFYWTAEDVGTPHALSAEDLDFSDSPGDPDTLKDNVIGYNWAVPPRGLGDAYKLRFWHSVPHDWNRCPERGSTTCARMDPHGTEVGSIAAAKFSASSNIAGLAHYCEVYFVRTKNDGEAVPVSDEMDAITHAAQHAKIINMSWGNRSSAGLDDLKDAMDFAAEDSQCVLVSITHNDGLSNKVRWPAAWDNVMAVGAMNRDRTLASYSNYHSDSLIVDVVAPVDDGIVFDSHPTCAVMDTLTDCLNKDCSQCTQTEFVSAGWGTSLAAPQVSGTAALIRSRFPNMRQDSVRARIKRAAEWYWPDTYENHAKFGAGKLNAYRSITEWGRVPMEFAEDSMGHRTSTHHATWGGHRSGWPDTLYVSGDLYVEEGDTLLLQEGTVIRIAAEPIVHHEGSELNLDPNRVEIVIKGALKVLGDSGDPAVFESFTANPQTNEDWAGIRFESGSEGVLRNLVVRNAATAIRTYVPLVIEEVTLSDGIEGIEAHTGVEVTTGEISHFTAYGVEVLKGHTTLDGVTITDCGIGIALAGYEGSANDSTSVSCSASTISESEFHGVATSTWDHRYLFLEDDQIESNGDIGVSLLPGCRADVQTCTFTDNDIGVLLVINPKPVSVTGCEIEADSTFGIYCYGGGSNYYLGGNTIQSSPVGIYCYLASPLIQNGNTITGNTTGIQCDAGSNPVLEWNTISSNAAGVWALSGSNPDLGHAVGGSSIGNNTITGNSSYHILNQSSSVTVVAENNWWGSAGGPDPGKISGSVDYDPWLTTAPGPPPSPAPPAEGEEEEEVVAKLPTRFSLSPGYPNPFNPTTTLRVEVPAPGSDVRVAIYDVQGRAVRTLLDAYRGPGIYNLTWDGRTDRGENAASGVYFAQMRTVDFVETHKIVLIK